MSQDRGSNGYQEGYQQGRVRVEQVRRHLQTTRAPARSDGSELGQGTPGLQTPQLPLPPSQPTSPSATTTALDNEGVRHTEGYPQAQDSIAAHRQLIVLSSNAEVSDPNRPVATPTPIPHHSHANGGAGPGAGATAGVGGEEDEQSWISNFQVFGGSDIGIRHGNADPPLSQGQSEAPHQTPTAQPSQSRTNLLSRVLMSVLSTLLSLLYALCPRRKKCIFIMLLVALWLRALYRNPYFGFLVGPLGRTLLSCIPWCLRTGVVHPLLRAADVDPSIAVCDSSLYNNGGSDGADVHFHEEAKYVDVLEANGWILENRWDDDWPMMSMSSSKASSSSPSNSTALTQARQDLMADYEFLITILRQAVTSKPITPTNLDLISLAESELRRQLSLSRGGLDGARTDLGRELVAAADAASHARRGLLFLTPMCRPACYLVRMEFARFGECAGHSLGVQLAGRLRMATCDSSGEKKDEMSSPCIHDPWDFIVTLLERMLGAWQHGTMALRESDARLLSIIQRIDAMLLPHTRQGLLPLLESQAASAAGASTSGDRGGDGAQDTADAKAKAKAALAALKLAPPHFHMLEAHCAQLCDLLSSGALPLPDSCAQYPRQKTKNTNVDQDWMDDAWELLHRAREARASQWGGIVAWRLDGHEVLQTLADVEVLARVAELGVKRLVAEHE